VVTDVQTVSNAASRWGHISTGLLVLLAVADAVVFARYASKQS
jgi:hypothetical protein